VGDLDGYNDIDILGSFSDGTRWFENTMGQEQGGFPVHNVQLGTSSTSAIGDLDSDGDQDVIVWVDNVISWVENIDGRGTYSSPRQILPLDNKANTALMATDLDGDNDTDIVVYSRFHSLLVWYENENAGTAFSPHALSLRGSSPPIVQDIDLDGDRDLLIDGSIFRNDGLGEFSEDRVITGATRIVGAGDVDLDGDLDLVTRTNTSLRWRENLGNHFADRQELVAKLESDNTAVVADMGPGQSPNVLVVNQDQSRLTWLDFRLPGDANDDGVFDSSDLTFALQAGEYEDDVSGNSTYQTGDWNGDGEFTSEDLVLAFQAGVYVGA
jgi:hypothetical protein